MNKNQRQLHVAFSLLLLLVSCVASAHAQPASGRPPRQTPPADERQRPQTEGGPQRFDPRVVEESLSNSLLVRIRYKTEYGYKYKGVDGAPASCDAFSVSFAKTPKPQREGYLIAIPSSGLGGIPLKEEDGYYFCEFLISGLSLDQEVIINASVNDQEPWLGGSQSKPPSGWRRALTDKGTRSASLTQSEPRATMNFEMIYEPISEMVQPRRPSGSVIIKPQ